MPKQRAICALDDSGKVTNNPLCWVVDAEPADAQRVITAHSTGHDGRSVWMWVRLQNGDLMLATFPQGATYEAVTEIAGV